MKGIMFTGDSFTWGEGLQYFANVSNTIFHTKHTFDMTELTNAHVKFKDKNRFSRIVADYFNTWEITNAFYGGSIGKCIEEVYNNKKIFEDIDCLVFQLTEIWRGDIEIYSKKLEKMILFNHDIIYSKRVNLNEIKIHKNNLQLLINEYGDELENLVNQYQLNEVKKLFNYLEENGIHCKIFSWTELAANYFIKDEYFNNKWIYFENRINNINTLYEIHPKFSVHGSLYEKYNVQKYDCHLSLEGHLYIAKQIIDNLKNINFKNEKIDIVSSILNWKGNRNKLI